MSSSSSATSHAQGLDFSYMSTLLKSNLNVEAVYVVKLVGISGIVYLQTPRSNMKHSTDYVWWPGGKMEPQDIVEECDASIIRCASREWTEETGTRLTGTVIDFVTGVVSTGRMLDRKRNAVFLIVRDNNLRYGDGFTTHEGTIRLMTAPQFETWLALVQTNPAYKAILEMIFTRIKQPAYSVRNMGVLILSAVRSGVWPNVRHCNLCNIDYTGSDHVVTQQHVLMLQQEYRGRLEIFAWCDGKCNKRNVLDGLVWSSKVPGDVDACSTWKSTGAKLQDETHVHLLENAIVNVCRTCGGLGNIQTEAGTQKYLAGCGLMPDVILDEPAPPDDARGGLHHSTALRCINSYDVEKVEQVHGVTHSKD